MTLFELHFDGPLSLGHPFRSDDGEPEATERESSAGTGDRYRGSGDAADEDLVAGGGGMP
jgi:hypothetical protein